MTKLLYSSNESGSTLGVRTQFDALRDKLQEMQALDALEMLDQSLASLERVESELDGMTGELLTVYEQLGTVFEVCKKLSNVSGEKEVVELFVESLQYTFGGRMVVAVYPIDEAAYEVRALDATLPRCLFPGINRAREQAKVLVESNIPDAQEAGITDTLIGPVYANGVFVCAIVIVRNGHGENFRASDMAILESLTTFCGDLVCNHRLVYELRSMSVSMVRSLVNAVDQKDPYTCGHSLRVGYYATMLGRRLGLRGSELQMLQWSALLHDVGKIGIRDDVLKKEGKLTDEEFDHIKEHPVRSYEVVKGVPQLQDALDGVLYHHEHYDGRGYPEGLVGEDIPSQARIIQIADVFDALTSNRSYRKAFDWRKALGILYAESGTTVDPYMCQIFDALMRSKLEREPTEWDRMIVEATAFAQDMEEPVSNEE